MPDPEPFVPPMPAPLAEPDYAQPAPAAPGAAAPPPAVEPVTLAVPTSAARAAAPAELLRKLEIEAAMLAAPQDRSLRGAYIDHLGRIAVANTGLLTANFPELGAPLFFRCGTPDIAVIANIFRDESLAFELRSTPQRILVLGAYAGYATVDLARRFPRAQILAVEPLPDNFRLLSLNTGPWKRVRCANVAVWHHHTRLATNLRFQADWALRLTDEAEEAERTVPAVSVKEILARAGWPAADLIVCDAGGAEREVFADPLAPWLPALDAALVKLHEPVAPRATEWVNAAFDPTVFTRGRVGDMEFYQRREPRTALPPDLPPELPLVRSEPGLTPFALADIVQAAFGFFVFEGGSCQLHPNPPGGKPARALFTLRAAGHRRFVAGVQHAGRAGSGITFTAAVQREDGAVAGRGEVVMKPRETGRLVIDLGEPLTGTARVVLQTEMVPEAANSNMAWARWLDPKLV